MIVVSCIEIAPKMKSEAGAMETKLCAEGDSVGEKLTCAEVSKLLIMTPSSTGLEWRRQRMNRASTSRSAHATFACVRLIGHISLSNVRGRILTTDRQGKPKDGKARSCSFPYLEDVLPAPERNHQQFRLWSHRAFLAFDRGWASIKLIVGMKSVSEKMDNGG